MSMPSGNPGDSRRAQSRLVITQVKSSNGSNGRQRDTLRSLGLRGIGKSVEREDSQPLRGMVHAVRHLVTVQEKS